MSRNKIPERADLGVLIAFVDETGEPFEASQLSSITSWDLEVIDETKYANLLRKGEADLTPAIVFQTGGASPPQNPLPVKIPLASVDVDDRSELLRIEVKYVYDSQTLGSGVTARSHDPVLLRLTPMLQSA